MIEVRRTLSIDERGLVFPKTRPGDWRYAQRQHHRVLELDLDEPTIRDVRLPLSRGRLFVEVDHEGIAIRPDWSAELVLVRANWRTFDQHALLQELWPSTRTWSGNLHFGFVRRLVALPVGHERPLP